MRYVELTNQGLVRKLNEDALRVIENQWGFCAMVCDGIGGANAGDVASNFVVNAFTEAFSSVEPLETEADATTWFHKTMVHINKALFELAESETQYKGMGTTASIVIITDAYQIGFNMGDSRIYTLVDDTLLALSHDQTYAYEMYLRNEITFEEQEVHPKRNILMNAVGIKEHIEYEVVTIDDTWDYIMVCSDGLHGYVAHEALEQSLCTHDLNVMANELLEKALKAGGPDNISFIVIAGEENV